jgi:hypothetical protein
VHIAMPVEESFNWKLNQDVQVLLNIIIFRLARAYARARSAQ